MNLDPGPIPELAPAGYETPFDAPGLADYVTGALAPLDAVENALDLALDPAAAILDELPDDGAGDLLDYSDAIFAQSADTLGTVPVANIDSAAQLVAEETVNVYSIIPGEGFQDLPPVEVPWTGGDGNPPPVPTQPTDASVVNLSRPGATDFAIGDRYQLNVHIHPDEGGGGTFAGVHVYADVFIDQVTEPTIDLGVTDPNGFISYQSSFTGDVAGQWQVIFYGTAPDGSQLNLTSITFNVAQQPGTPQIGVNYFVEELGYACEDCTVHVGFHFTLTVSGPPRQPVVITGTFDGIPFAAVNAGVTDDAGTFVLSGVIDQTALGEWFERYSVGGVDWGRQLHILVLPPL